MSSDNKDSNPESEPQPPQPIKEAIIPHDIEDWISLDHALIREKKMTQRLPARISAESVLQEYLQSKRTHPDCEVFATFVSFLRDRFQKALGVTLLIKFERIQYYDFYTSQDDGVPYTFFYGAVHLARMLYLGFDRMAVRLKLPLDARLLIKDHASDLLQFMSSRVKSDYLKLDDYEYASPEYIRRSWTH